MVTAKHLARAVVPREVRNWLRSPIGSLGWAWAQAKYYAGGKSVLQIRPGWSLISHPAAFDFAYFAQSNDPDQVAEFDSFIREITDGAVLLDIGAHFGLFSLATLHYGGPTARAVAVDPSPLATGFIKKQAKLNDVSDRLQIVQAAVGNQIGWQPMISVGILSSGYFVQPSKDHPESELTQIPTTTLDKLAEDLALWPTHIKIDVEGQEFAVIEGGSKLLSHNNAPLLFIELHNEMVSKSGGSPGETLRLLRSFKYETFANNGERLNEREILDKPLIRIVAKRDRCETKPAPHPFAQSKVTTGLIN
jgi:FkbM family methyltransferase